jgi:hypothetical protein
MGWRSIANRLAIKGQHDLANDVQRLVDRMSPVRAERELIGPELQQRIREPRIRDQHPVR